MTTSPEQSAELGRLTVELERIKLANAAANEAIGQRREELSKVEQEQARALTAAEVERNRGELYTQQQSQGAGTRAPCSGTAARRGGNCGPRNALAGLEQGMCGTGAKVFATLDREMKELVQQRTAALAEEERGASRRPQPGSIGREY